MNRQAGPSIVLSFLIVCFFAVVLFPGDPKRSRASTPRDPIAGPIVFGQPTAKPVPEMGPRSEPIVRSSADSVEHPAAKDPVVPRGSMGKVAPAVVAVPARSTQSSHAPVDSTRRSHAVSASRSERPPRWDGPDHGRSGRSPPIALVIRPARPSGSPRKNPSALILIHGLWYTPRRRQRNPVTRPDEDTRLQCTAEVDHVTVLDDVLLAFEPLEVFGLGLLDRAGLM